MYRHSVAAIGAACGVMLLSGFAWAEGSPGTITATGDESVRVQVSGLRLLMEIRTEGKTAKEALKQFNTKREEVTAKLKELGAEPSSIRFTATSVNVEMAAISEEFGPTANSQIHFPTRFATPSADPVGTYSPPTATPTLAPIPAPTSGTPSSGPTYAVPTPAIGVAPPIQLQSKFVARAMVRAKWTLDTSDRDRLALARPLLREKLVAAKLVPDSPVPEAPLTYTTPVGPSTEDPPSAPAYPAPTVMPSSYYPLGSGADSFDLKYVGQPCEKAAKTALAAAVAKAKRKAADLAEAAGCHAGALVSISSDSHASSYVSSSYLSPVMAFHDQVPSQSFLNDGARCELASTAPELPEVVTHVTLQYQIVP